MTTHVVAFAYPSANQEDPQLGVTLIQSRGKFFGYVDAPDQKAAEVEAAKAFTLSEWQRKPSAKLG